MDLGITCENVECCICGAGYKTKDDFGMIVSRQELLFFCPKHIDSIDYLLLGLKDLIEMAEQKKIKHLRIRINSIKPQLKLLRMEG